MTDALNNNSSNRSSSTTIDPLSRTTFAGLWPLVLIVMLGFLTVGAPLPVLSLYLHNDLGFDSFTVGWVIGIQSLITVLSRHRAGLLCDRRGARFVVLAGLPLAALAGALYIASVVIPASDTIKLAILVAGRILLGIGESLFMTGTMTWGIYRIGAPRTGRVMSWQGIGMYVALGLGAPLGLAIYGKFGFVGVGALTILTPLLATLIAGLLPAVSVSGGDRAAFHEVIGLIWRPGAVLALASVPFAAMAAFLPLDYAIRGWQGAGLAMTAFGAAYIAVRLVGSHWQERVGAVRVIGISFIVMGAGQVLLWLAPNPAIALCGATLTGAGFSLVFPAMGVIATNAVPIAQRGRAVGNFIAFFDIAVGLTAPIVGLITGVFGYPSAFIVGIVATAAAAAMLLSLSRMKT